MLRKPKTLNNTQISKYKDFNVTIERNQQQCVWSFGFGYINERRDISGITPTIIALVLFLLMYKFTSMENEIPKKIR